MNHPSSDGQAVATIAAGHAPGAEVPVSSTGVQNPSGRLGIGWAQGTTHSTSCQDVREGLGQLFGPAVLRRSGLQWYERAWSLGDAGVVVADSPRSGSSDPAEVYVVIPQGALDPLGFEGQVRVLVLLDALGVRLSRVDVYFDDLLRLADPADVAAAWDRGDRLTRVKAGKVVRDFSGGMTVYLGSRTGECMVRVYRKWAESGNPADGVRWEMEAKGERAPIVAGLLRASSAPAVTYFELLRLHCDWRDTSDGKRADRAPLLGWWASLVGSASRARLAARVTVDTLARKVAWLRRQVAPTLALLFGARGSLVVNDLIEEGWPRARWDLLPAPVGTEGGASWSART